jgi:predicted dehydrogenase
MQEQDLRVGLIGYGLAGAVFHAPLVATTAGLRLSAIVTSNAERRREAERKHQGVRIVPDADALWDLRSDLDVVVVASPNSTHVPLAHAAIAAGLPVVVDKPLAATSAEATALIRESREKHVLLTVFQNRRWDGDFMTLRRLMDDGRLGAVRRFESRFERWRPSVKPGWKTDASHADAGGLLYDLGSHLIDQALVLFGPVTHVYAELDRRREGMQADDDAFVALTHESGVRSQLWMSAVAPQLGPRFRVLGSRAGFTKFGLDPQEDRLAKGADPREPGWSDDPEDRWGRVGTDAESEAVRTEPGRYAEFYALLVEALRGRGPAPVDPRDAVASLMVVEAARQSAEEGSVVVLR